MQLLSKGITKKTLSKVIALLALILVPVLVLLGFFFQFNGRVYPNVFVAGINFGGKTPTEAQELLSRSFRLPESITLMTDNDSHQLSTNSLGAEVEYTQSVQNAYAYGRSGTFIDDVSKVVSALFSKQQLNPVIKVEDELLTQQISAYAEIVTNPSVDPSVFLVGDEINVILGESGSELNVAELRNQVIKRLETGSLEPIQVNIYPADNTLNESQVLAAKLRAQKLLNKNLKLTFEHQEFTFTQLQLLSFINPAKDYYPDRILKEVEKIARALDREPQNPVFSFQDGKVQEFKPAKDGVSVNQEKLVAMIIDSLRDFEREEFDNVVYTIPVSSTPPTINMDEINNLGIKELIGRGTSTFKGSIPSRVYNINLAASRLNGVLIKPGEEFSFNKALGDVSSLTGYKQAYVIQGGRTVLGDGGGVCQVSTTFFRAALNSGLPIIERNPHSYRVTYYEQDSGPGLDASIYTPTLDLKIKNDTPGHILIQTIPDLQNMTLVFEFYGTSDGRKATVGKPVVTSQSAAPEPLYIDDPTLPTGQIKQIDFAAGGAKAQFEYKVERNGEVLIEKTFYSNYRPWQAKYLRGTGPTI